jgi:peptide/nickel transport system ATP-binding protein
MYAGRIVESGGAAALFTAPRHPYTAALLQAIPRLDDDLAVPRLGIDGQAPNPLERPPGCAFAPRCAYAFDLCRTASPRLLDVGAGRAVACHRDAAGMTLP